jgi:hypothetical protein
MCTLRIVQYQILFNIYSTIMNSSYFNSGLNDYSTPYNYSFQYSSPSTPPYFYSPMLLPSCPVHSSQIFYTSSPSSMNISPLPYNYYQQQSEVNSPPVQQRMYQIFFLITINQVRSFLCQLFISQIAVIHFF